jgi:hypothetical protein
MLGSFEWPLLPLRWQRGVYFVKLPDVLDFQSQVTYCIIFSASVLGRLWVKGTAISIALFYSLLKCIIIIIICSRLSCVLFPSDGILFKRIAYYIQTCKKTSLCVLFPCIWLTVTVRQIQMPPLDIWYSQHSMVVYSYISSDVWVLTEMTRGIIIVSLQLYCKILCEPLSIWVFGSICRKKLKCAYCLVCGGQARELCCVM